jgi:hypothetical protein
MLNFDSQYPKVLLFLKTLLYYLIHLAIIGPNRHDPCSPPNGTYSNLKSGCQDFLYAY